jgi:nucleoid DNA-binding protein
LTPVRRPHAREFPAASARRRPPLGGFRRLSSVGHVDDTRLTVSPLLPLAVFAKITEDMIAGRDVNIVGFGKFEVGGARAGTRDRVGAQRPSRSARMVRRARSLSRCLSPLTPTRAPAPPRPARLVAAHGDPQRIVQPERNSLNPKKPQEKFVTKAKYKPRFKMSSIFKKKVAEVKVSAKDAEDSKTAKATAK